MRATMATEVPEGKKEITLCLRDIDLTSIDNLQGELGELGLEHGFG